MDAVSAVPRLRKAFAISGWRRKLFSRHSPSKTAFLNTQDDAYRQILRQIPFYARAIQSNLPFPKTRRIVFLNNQPASLPGFVHLELYT